MSSLFDKYYEMPGLKGKHFLNFGLIVSPPDVAKRNGSSRGYGGLAVSSSKSKWATVREVAEYLNCHPRTVQRLMAKHAVRVSNVGRAVRIDMNSVEKYMDGNACEQAI